MATRKIGPALAAGCTVVLKPAAETPLTALAIAALLEEAGVPAGVVNVVLHRRSGAARARDARRPARAQAVLHGLHRGRARAARARRAEAGLSCSMELGGNAPFLVLDDADLDVAIAGAMAAKMRNGGEACTAANRFLVHESVAEDFTAGLADAMARRPRRATASTAARSSGR